MIYQSKSMEIDLIFTDILGLKDLKSVLKSKMLKVGCRLRVVDSFGTEAPYNDEAWVNKSPTNKKK